MNFRKTRKPRAEVRETCYGSKKSAYRSPRASKILQKIESYRIAYMFIIEVSTY